MGNRAEEFPGILRPPSDKGFGSARLYRVEVQGPSNSANGKVSGAVLLPDVNGYPKDKIEIIAPFLLKSALGVTDGDQLTLEFAN